MWELHQLFYVKDSEETVDKLTDEFKKISISHEINTTFCFAYMFVRSVLEKMLPAFFFVVLLCAMKLLNFFELRAQQTRCMKRIEGILLKECKNLEDT